PLFGEVRSSVRRGNPEIRLSFDRETLSLHALTAEQASALLQEKIAGVISTDFTYGDQRIDVRVELDESDKPNVQAIFDLRLTEGLTVGEAINYTYAEGPSEIRRRGNQRTAVVSASPT